MSLRMSTEEFERIQSRNAGRKPIALPSPVVEVATVTKPTAMQRMQAKGRLAKGQMNQSEERYAQVLEARKAAGEILWWVFEGIKLKLAPNTHLSIDFAVMLADGTLQMHDVKGAKAIIAEDAKVKMKVARSLYPFPMFYAFPPKKGGEWVLEEIGG